MRNSAVVSSSAFPVWADRQCVMLVAGRGQEAVHPIRFASDSRITLLAAVSNPPGSDRLPAQVGTIFHKVQSVRTTVLFLVPVAKDAICDDQKRSVASSSVWAHDGLIKVPEKMRSEAHCPNLLTVYYFKTSSGGIPAPSCSIPYRRSVASTGGPQRRKHSICGVHSLRLHGGYCWSLAP